MRGHVCFYVLCFPWAPVDHVAWRELVPICAVYEDSLRHLIIKLMWVGKPTVAKDVDKRRGICNLQDSFPLLLPSPPPLSPVDWKDRGQIWAPHIFKACQPCPMYKLSNTNIRSCLNYTMRFLIWIVIILLIKWWLGFLGMVRKSHTWSSVSIPSVRFICKSQHLI